MTPPLVTILVGFGSVAAGIAADRKMAKYIRYQTHAQVLREHPDFDWRAVVDPDSEVRRAAREDWNVPIVAASIAELPSDLRPEVAVLATKPDVRGEPIDQLPGLRAAVVEKPLGCRLEDSKAFVELCRRRGVMVQVNLFRRADRTYQPLLAGDLEEHVGAAQAVTALYGNGLLNNGLHMIDLARMLLGEVVAARALGPFRLLDKPVVPRDVDVAAALTLNNGCVVALQPLDFGFYRDVMLDVWGRKGRLEIYQEGLFLRRSPLKPHRALEGTMEVAIDEPIALPSYCGTAYYAVYDNLAGALKGECELLSPAENALKSETVVDAILRSALEGGRLVEITPCAAERMTA